MVDHNGIHEPPIDPQADTNPSLTLHAVQIETGPLPAWRRAIGFVSLLAAAGLTAATALILMTPPSTPPAPAPATDVMVTEDAGVMALTAAPTQTIPPTAPPVVAGSLDVLPTIGPDVAASLLALPLADLAEAPGLETVRNVYDPFTIVPDRPRGEVIQYTAVQGDTIYTIAERFDLKPETIAWSNSRRIVQVLRPGDVINILPVDGVYYQQTGSRTIAEIATEYQLSDPYVIIDSEYNTLFGSTPETIPVNGIRIVVPGGLAEDITWNPGVTVEQSGERRGFVSAFAPGDPGSCGNVQNPGGGAAWGAPLRSAYTITRGFSSFHTGIDLAAPVGTPVFAANSGAVVFAGWSTWGYGRTVVLAHGPFLTLYGHLDSINVGCGQLVSVGQVIAAVGNTGNSSGPHLHFEIRSGDTLTDPTATIRF